jgi:hypothetical protein
MGTYLPLGTFLALGAAVTYLWGDALIDWYLQIAMPHDEPTSGPWD